MRTRAASFVYTRRLIFGPKKVFVFEWEKGLMITMETVQERSAEHVGISVSV